MNQQTGTLLSISTSDFPELFLSNIHNYIIFDTITDNTLRLPYNKKGQDCYLIVSFLLLVSC